MPVATQEETKGATSTEFTIEIDYNSTNVMFNPLSKVLRGRWNKHLIPGYSEKRYMQIPVIPGLQITLNVATKKAVVHDPLNDKEWAEAKHILKASGDFVPVEDAEYELNKDGVATWAHWMKRFLSQGKATLVRGEVPQNVPGDPRIEFFDSAPAKNKKILLKEIIEE